MIKLNITKASFRKKLLLLGYDYNISNYENFIESIQQRVKRLLINSFPNDDFEDTISLIFGDNYVVDAISLKNHKNIQKISDKYLITLIEEGILDLYFSKSKNKEFSLRVMNLAYNIRETKDITFKKDSFYAKQRLLKDSWIYEKGSSYYTALKCLKKDKIELSDIRETSLDANIIHNVYMELKYQYNIEFDSLLGDLKSLDFSNELHKEYDFNKLYKINGISDIQKENYIEITYNEELKIQLDKYNKIIDIIKNTLITNNYHSHYILDSLLKNLQYKSFFNSLPYYIQDKTILSKLDELEELIKDDVLNFKKTPLKDFEININFNGKDFPLPLYK